MSPVDFAVRQRAASPRCGGMKAWKIFLVLMDMDGEQAECALFSL
jgi:hypothetical protein